MKIKTSELTGAALDWAVAKSVGKLVDPWHNELSAWLKDHPYSTDWSLAGPIIEREHITIVCAEGEYDQSKAGTPDCFDTYWVADIGRQTADSVYGPQGDDWGQQFQTDAESMQGPTPLIAAMRCYVASKLGDEVDVPDELG